jgi:hypothetical protein
MRVSSLTFGKVKVIGFGIDVHELDVVVPTALWVAIPPKLDWNQGAEDRPPAADLDHGDAVTLQGADVGEQLARHRRQRTIEGHVCIEVAVLAVERSEGDNVLLGRRYPLVDDPQQVGIKAHSGIDDHS